MRIVSPVAVPAAPAGSYAVRPKQLPGLALGALVNGKEYSAEVLHAIVGRLDERHGFADRIWWDKGFPAKAAPFLDDIVRRAPAVINGVGH